MSIGTNASLMKENNKKLILNLIRQGDFSRAEISKTIGLTKASVTIIVDELIKDNMVYEEESDYSGVGRKPVYLRLKDDFAYAIGVNITRHLYRVGLVDINGRLISVKGKKHNNLPPDKVLDEISRLISEMVKIVSNKKILGIGVVTPGPVDYKTGTILKPPNFSMWHGCEIAKRLAEKCGISVRLENISNACALSEKYFGSCRSEKNYAYIIVDEGIGSGIVIDGSLFRGQNGNGNELGHTSINLEGEKCECGNVGCLEKYASIDAILKNTGYKSWKEAVDFGAKDLIEKEKKYLSVALVNLINLFDLNKIIIGGDLAYSGEWFAKELFDIVNKKIITGNTVSVSIGADIDKTVVAASSVINEFFT